jgi:hypothetical protein
MCIDGGNKKSCDIQHSSPARDQNNICSVINLLTNKTKLKYEYMNLLRLVALSIDKCHCILGLGVLRP